MVSSSPSRPNKLRYRSEVETYLSERFIYTAEQQEALDVLRDHRKRLLHRIRFELSQQARPKDFLADLKALAPQFRSRVLKIQAGDNTIQTGYALGAELFEKRGIQSLFLSHRHHAPYDSYLLYGCLEYLRVKGDSRKGIYLLPEPSTRIGHNMTWLDVAEEWRQCPLEMRDVDGFLDYLWDETGEEGIGACLDLIEYPSQAVKSDRSLPYLKTLFSALSLDPSLTFDFLCMDPLREGAFSNHFSACLFDEEPLLIFGHLPHALLPRCAFLPSERRHAIDLVATCNHVTALDDLFLLDVLDRPYVVDCVSLAETLTMRRLRGATSSAGHILQSTLYVD